jgi:CHASE2 domain-containing sensor protein
MKSATEPARPGSYLGYVWGARWFFVASLLLGYLFHHSSPGHLLDGLALDSLLLLHAPRPVEDVVVVAIDDTDYEQLFADRSPLDVGQLEALLSAVARGRPRVIGVDLDTSASEFASLGSLARDIDGIPVVWATDAIPDADGDHGHPRFAPVGLLGRPVHDGDRAGVALVPLDADGVVRRYRRCFTLAHHGEPGALPSVGHALAAAPATATCTAEEDEPLVFNFAGDRYRIPTIPARHVLTMAESAGFAEDGVLRDKVVVVGGTWRVARDSYVTPVGLVPGVEVVAQAAATELHGGGVRPIDAWLAFVADVLLGLGLLWIGYRLSFRRALLAGLLLLLAGPIAISLLFFSAFSHWFSFVPLLIGLYAHFLFEHGREYMHLHARNEALKAELERLSARPR